MKKLTMLFSILCLTLALTVPASALDYNIDGPGDPEYGKSTSIEPVATADRGELPNVDVSKNAALIPPGFGSPSAYTLNTGTPLTPNLAPGYKFVDNYSHNWSRLHRHRQIYGLRRRLDRRGDHFRRVFRR